MTPEQVKMSTNLRLLALALAEKECALHGTREIDAIVPNCDAQKWYKSQRTNVRRIEFMKEALPDLMPSIASIHHEHDSFTMQMEREFRNWAYMRYMALQWVSCGMPTIAADIDLLHEIVRSDPTGIDGEAFIPAPWPAFVVVLPKNEYGLSGMYGDQSEHSLSSVWCCSGGKVKLSSEDDEEKDGLATMILSGSVMHVSVLRVANGETFNFSLASDEGTPDWTSRDQDTLMFTQRLLCGLLLAMKQNGGAIGTPTTLQRRKMSRRDKLTRRLTAIGAPSLPKVWNLSLAGFSRIMCPGSTHGKKTPPPGGWKLGSRFVVRGHYRRQACGEGRQERKTIWIRPHWKGPEDAPGKTTSYHDGKQAAEKTAPN